MRKPQFKNKVAKGAFTLIEILVVLVIMGFLVSLVAPKLAGIVDGAVDTNCDTNQERLRKVLNAWTFQKVSLPAGMANMVVTNTNGDRAIIPSVDDDNKDNGAETLSADFEERFLPQVHYINADEATELNDMGVNAVFAVGRTSVAAGTAPTLADNVVEKGFRQEVAAGLPVMMAGVGIGQGATVPTFATSALTLKFNGSAVTQEKTDLALNAGTMSNANDATVDATMARMDEARHLGRILLGVTNQSELVQKGMIDESGTCPGQIQNADSFDWGNYLVVMPRLSATYDRLVEENAGDGTTGLIVKNANTEKGQVHIVALGVDTGESATGNTIEGRSPNAGDPSFTSQTLQDHTTSCPEGHSWGAQADSYAIKVDIN